MLLYRSTESEESVERRMYLRSLAAEKLVEQQKQTFESLKVRLQSQPHPDKNLPASEQTAIPENEYDDDYAEELSVGEFLKKQMYKRVSH